MKKRAVAITYIGIMSQNLVAGRTMILFQALLFTGKIPLY